MCTFIHEVLHTEKYWSKINLKVNMTCTVILLLQVEHQPLFYSNTLEFLSGMNNVCLSNISIVYN